MGGNQTYSWDPQSATRKGTANMEFGINTGVVSIKKKTNDYNPKTDAFRSCGNCGKHYNYHGKK